MAIEILKEIPNKNNLWGLHIWKRKETIQISTLKTDDNFKQIILAIEIRKEIPNKNQQQKNNYIDILSVTNIQQRQNGYTKRGIKYVLFHIQ